MTASFTMYTTQWCGYCVRLKHGLERVGLTFAEVDIEQDESAAERVMQVNGGNQTVPTLEFADGSALTNPTVQQVQEKLAALV
ncbi:MAG: mycoredoxin [Jatrophihabitantaceae bacterium]